MSAIDALSLAGDLHVGSLEVRLARSEEEVAAAQALRYQVFYEEMRARPSEEMARSRRDFDRYDPLCDHLLVLDHARGSGAAAIVATYRLIQQAAAEKAGGFYSASEYDLARLFQQPGNLLELGRSCVEMPYRNRPTMQLLWRGIAAYVFHYDIAFMFGCASLPGTDPLTRALPLAYLYHHHLAPDALLPRALPERYVDMRLMAADAMDLKAAINQLPPLIKGYLRLGGFVGDGAVIDHQFNTIDVCVIVKTALLTDKYFQHYTRTARDAVTL